MKKAYFIGAWCIFISFIILMICSRSSFLYPCNDWNDANSFFTIGKAVMNGQVPYRDLFEQKGVYLYLIYGIAYLISNNSFLGVFILEVLSMAVFLFFSHKLIVLYCQEQTSLFLLPFLAFGLIVSRSFYWGGAAEEFCLPLMCISLYDTVHYFKDGCFEAPSFKMILKNGILAGIISLIKYTLLGFYFAWIGMIVLSCIVYKNYKKAINSCFVFGGGIFWHSFHALYILHLMEH